MDKQKQIEELIGIIQGAVGGCATYWASLIAEEVLKFYQPKIPENAVVLTDDNAEELADMIVKSPQMQKTMSRLIKAWEKETAENIADWLDNEKGYCGLGYLVKQKFCTEKKEND